MAYSGLFKPRNPQKYVGDPTNIVYRSSWECRMMTWLDNNDNVISWSSEELIIPYKSPIDGKWHRYFPDFLVKTKTREGKLKTLLLEVKPKKQAQPPAPQKRITEQYINSVKTWGVNEAKWKAAIEYCKDHNWEFKIITEDHLGLTK
jgi:hypothetical protein